jgi:acyl dehydratase
MVYIVIQSGIVLLPQTAVTKRRSNMPTLDTDDFEVVFPGAYTARERPSLAKYLSDNHALQERGPIDPQALGAGTLPAGTPGVQPGLPVREDMVRYNNAKYDPENPLLNDAAYARARGYRDILAMPCFGAHDDTFMAPCPAEMRDTLLVSQLNHSVTTYRPICPGDVLYMVADRRSVTDLTPTEGSVYRSLALRTEGSVYNQRGEKVNDTVWRVVESMRQFKPGRRPEDFDPADLWESPDWIRRPGHFYTDADWELIIHIWSKEHRLGARLRHWEDVKVGDEPAWTADGPIDDTVMPTTPFGQGTGGTRTLRREIMDPASRRLLIRGEGDGVYRTPRRDDYAPPIPEHTGVVAPVPAFAEDGVVDTRDIHRVVAGARAPLINFYGRDIAIRHLHNWMGEDAWLKNIRWGLMPASTMAAYGKPAPVNPDAVRFLDPVPYMRGRDAEEHGLTRDLALVKSYVYDKYVCDGEFLVELAWWIEAITGHIWLTGGATIELPSRRAPGPSPAERMAGDIIRDRVQARA